MNVTIAKRGIPYLPVAVTEIFTNLLDLKSSLTCILVLYAEKLIG
jgi:hypothetical protein